MEAGISNKITHIVGDNINVKIKEFCTFSEYYLTVKLQIQESKSQRNHHLFYMETEEMLLFAVYGGLLLL